ncbi:hypothetical protein PUN28_002159 [Cardiocondyla obscurior]|uniref:DUF4806 domain-containing protein n=1 Tax=Cardiocondyla obscurior TaxID=286306 RepID=A0AAW2GSX5_9HYME
MEEVKYEILTLKRNQEYIKEGMDILLTTNNNIDVNKFSRLLPITTVESFNDIDNALGNSEEDFKSLMQYLNLAHGETVNQLVPSVMKLIMKKDVSIHFSGCGKKKKRDFSATNIAAAVFGKYSFTFFIKIPFKFLFYN